jgi:hypothetical protein
MAGFGVPLSRASRRRAWAKQPEPKVKVTVVVCLASERCPFIDPRLKNVAEGAKSEPKLSGFRLVSMTDMSLAGDAKGSLSPSRREGRVKVKHCMDKDNKVWRLVTPLTRA